MLNITKNAKNRRQSKFLGQRRTFFLTKRISKIGLKFLKINQGKVTQSKTEAGSLRVTFESKHTGRTAFAYGADFRAAYENMIKLFYIKYAA